MAEPPDGPWADTVSAIEAYLLGESPHLTRLEVAEQAGVPLDVAESLWHALGFAHHGDEDRAFTASDVEALSQTHELMRLGVLSPDSQAALVRTWGRAFARLAEWQTTLLARVAMEQGDPEVAVADLAAAALPKVDALQGYVWRRHLASATHRLLNDAVLGDDEPTMTVCFVDIVGYTATSRGLDEHELVAWVERFEQEAAGLVVDHGGRVIKTIGDEVLFTVDDPAAALEVALALTSRGSDPDDSFPQVRAGLAHGPVVRRLGDVFGSTVNAAARLTAAARPGTVVADNGVREAVTVPLRWTRLRRVRAKGFDRLEAWRVRPPKPDQDSGKLESPAAVDGGNNNDRA